jgi:hypothetical protein
MQQMTAAELAKALEARFGPMVAELPDNWPEELSARGGRAGYAHLQVIWPGIEINHRTNELAGWHAGGWTEGYLAAIQDVLAAMKEAASAGK